MKLIYIVTSIVAVVLSKTKAQKIGEEENEGAWGNEYILAMYLWVSTLRHFIVFEKHALKYFTFVQISD